MLIIVPIAVLLCDFALVDLRFPPYLQDTPLIMRVLIWLVVYDFGYYWMHVPAFWRVHKWHQYPTYMYLLTGCRATIQQQFLVGIPYVLMSPILELAPWWVFTGIVMWSYLIVDWMHLYVPWGSRLAEWVFVTPRFYHSADPDHYDQNLGNLVVREVSANPGMIGEFPTRQVFAIARSPRHMPRFLAIDATRRHLIR